MSSMLLYIYIYTSKWIVMRMCLESRYTLTINISYYSLFVQLLLFLLQCMCE